MRVPPRVGDVLTEATLDELLCGVELDGVPVLGVVDKTGLLSLTLLLSREVCTFEFLSSRVSLLNSLAMPTLKESVKILPLVSVWTSASEPKLLGINWK